MKIAFASVYVDDQVKAMDFYTNILGFQEHSNIPVADDFWMTVVSPDAPDGAPAPARPGRPRRRQALPQGHGRRWHPAGPSSRSTTSKPNTSG